MCVGGLVPRPGAPYPAAPQIQIADHATKGQHPVIMAQIVTGHRGRIGHRTVMGIVKEQPIVVGPRPMRAETHHQIGLVPLVDDDQVGRIQYRIQIQIVTAILPARQHGIGPPEIAQWGISVLAAQVQPAPAVFRLVHRHAMPPRQQFSGYATQKVRVAMIPV